MNLYNEYKEHQEIVLCLNNFPTVKCTVTENMYKRFERNILIKYLNTDAISSRDAFSVEVDKNPNLHCSDCIKLNYNKFQSKYKYSLHLHPFHRSGYVVSTVYKGKLYKGGYVVKAESWYDEECYKKIFHFSNKSDHRKDKLVFYLREDGGEEIINIKDIVGNEADESTTYFIMWSMFNMNLLTDNSKLKELHDELVEMGFSKIDKIKECKNISMLFTT